MSLLHRDHIIEFVGGTEVDVAYLRLLLRKAARELSCKWRLRTEDDRQVDIVVVEDFDSGAFRADASQRRVRLINPLLGAAGMQTVSWPIAQDTLVRLLNPAVVPAAAVPPPLLAEPPAPAPAAAPAAMSAPTPAPAITLGGLQIQHNIYDDLFEPEPDGATDGRHDHGAHEWVGQVDLAGDWLGGTPSRAEVEATLMREADAFFRADHRVDQVEALRQIRLHPDVQIEATEGHTEATGSRKDRRGVIELGSDTPYALNAAEADARHPLASYLSGRLLPAPAQIEAGDVVLVLDPRHRMYYARGALGLMEALCQLSLRRGDWRILSAASFAAIKAQIAPRPYAELQWLCAYFDERAAKEPDDILRYRILQNIDVLPRDYPIAARIARELEHGSSLKAAAAAAQVSLHEAKRVAAAFDAAGFLVPD